MINKISSYTVRLGGLGGEDAVVDFGKISADINQVKFAMNATEGLCDSDISVRVLTQDQFYDLINNHSDQYEQSTVYAVDQRMLNAYNSEILSVKCNVDSPMTAAANKQYVDEHAGRGISGEVKLSDDYSVFKSIGIDGGKLSASYGIMTAENISGLAEKLSEIDSVRSEIKKIVTVSSDGQLCNTLSVEKIQLSDFYQLSDEQFADNKMYVIDYDDHFDTFGMRVENVSDPELETDAVNKRYADRTIKGKNIVSALPSEYGSVIYGNEISANMAVAPTLIGNMIMSAPVANAPLSSQVCIGNGIISMTDKSIALGLNNRIYTAIRERKSTTDSFVQSGWESIAIGAHTRACGKNAVAIGCGDDNFEMSPDGSYAGTRGAGSDYAVAIGNAGAEGRAAVAIGHQNHAKQHSVSIGRMHQGNLEEFDANKCRRTGEGAVTIGQYSCASADYSIVIGNSMNSTVSGQTLIGAPNGFKCKTDNLLPEYGLSVADASHMTWIGIESDPEKIWFGLSSLQQIINEKVNEILSEKLGDLNNLSGINNNVMVVDRETP